MISQVVQVCRRSSGVLAAEGSIRGFDLEGARVKKPLELSLRWCRFSWSDFGCGGGGAEMRLANIGCSAMNEKSNTLRQTHMVAHGRDVDILAA